MGYLKCPNINPTNEIMNTQTHIIYTCVIVFWTIALFWFCFWLLKGMSSYLVTITDTHFTFCNNTIWHYALIRSLKNTSGQRLLCQWTWLTDEWIVEQHDSIGQHCQQQWLADSLSASAVSRYQSCVWWCRSIAVNAWSIW